jgi:hypothetical protein
MPVHSGHLYATPGGNGVPEWQPAWTDTAQANLALLYADAHIQLSAPGTATP